MTTSTITESIHLKRLREFQERQDTQYTDTHRTAWKVFHLTPDSLIEWKRNENSYDELQLGGYQLIVVGINWEWRYVYDLSGNKINQSYVHDNEIGSYGDWTTENTYVAYAYRTGTDWDKIVNINWIGQFTTFAGTCTSNSKEKTLKLAKKKLEVYNSVLDRIGELIPLANEWANRSELETPYNVVIGDVVWIHAFGRIRQGIIVSTVGSRFVVGYVTPSNSYDLKFKVAPLSALRVKTQQP